MPSDLERLLGDNPLLIAVLNPLSTDPIHNDRLEAALRDALYLTGGSNDPFAEALSALDLYLKACCLGRSSTVVGRFLGRRNTSIAEVIAQTDIDSVLRLIDTLDQGLSRRSPEWLQATQLFTRQASESLGFFNPWNQDPLLSWRESNQSLEIHHLPHLKQLAGI